MKLLDQADIDVLLASGAQAPPRSPSDPSCTASDSTTPELPDQFRLAADENGIARLLPIKVPVQVRLAERIMEVAQLLDMTPGSIIEFDRPADSELDLYANNVPIGTGNAVKCGERFGLRTIKIMPWAQRLLAQGLIR
jgi:flagellar motor switch protein FliN/FliY